MGETNSPAVYKCCCGVHTELNIKHHAGVERWEERSDDPHTSILRAWADGIVLDAHDIATHNLQADEIRYHHETTTVILRRDIALVTAIDYRTARDGIQEAVIEGMIENECSSKTIAEAVNIANIGKHGLRDLAKKTKTEDENIRSDQGDAPGFAGTDLAGSIGG